MWRYDANGMFEFYHKRKIFIEHLFGVYNVENISLDTTDISEKHFISINNDHFYEM